MEKAKNQGEAKIRKIGGALESDYRQFCELTENINRKYFLLFELMGFNSPEDTDIAIDILLKDSVVYGAKEIYIARETERIRDGRLKLDDVLSERTLNRAYKTTEEKESVFKREIHRALALRYQKIRAAFLKERGLCSASINKFSLKVCGKALSLTPRGFVIDGEKFMEIYGDYLEANDSQTGNQHQEAAEAINRFFGGQVEITEEELRRYFVIEYGIVKPNPQSINREGYMRLGYRGKTIETEV